MSVVTSASWNERLAADAVRAHRNQTADQRVITAELLRRGREVGIQAFALTGSTARRRRTAISDLDFHVIGPRLDVRGLADEVDIVNDSEQQFLERLTRGDDFGQWTLRFGCVLFDDEAVMRRGADLVTRGELWPDPVDKLSRVEPMAELAEKVIRIGDAAAGQENVRAALTTMARGLLLAQRIFPLARAELPSQLLKIDELTLGQALGQTIRWRLSLPELTEFLDLVRNRLCVAHSVAAPKLFNARADGGSESPGPHAAPVRRDDT